MNKIHYSNWFLDNSHFRVFQVFCYFFQEKSSKPGCWLGTTISVVCHSVDMITLVSCCFYQIPVAAGSSPREQACSSVQKMVNFGRERKGWRVCGIPAGSMGAPFATTL